MSGCEWNPKHNKPAGEVGDTPDDGNCPNQAAVSLGAGKWHLCESCAALPEFKKFRARKPLRKEADHVA